MHRFNPDNAIFGALAATLDENPEESVFTYVNPAACELFGEALKGMKVVRFLEEILLSREKGRESFSEFLRNGSIILEGKFNCRDVQFHGMVESSSGHLQAAVMDTTESRRAQEGFEYTAGALARAAEVNDADTGTHIVRINAYSRKLAQLMNLEPRFVEAMGILPQLHDVGKIHTDPKILRKPGKLDSAEFEMMKQHTIFGAKIIGDHQRLSVARQIAIAHHEKWNGSGYPYGLSGEMMPLSARIVSVVDTFDALVSKRVYKPPIEYDRTFEIMTVGDEKTNPGADFSPTVHKVFLDNYDLFTGLHADLKD